MNKAQTAKRTLGRNMGDENRVRAGSSGSQVAEGPPLARPASGAGALLHRYRWQEGNKQGAGGCVCGFNGRG